MNYNVIGNLQRKWSKERINMAKHGFPMGMGGMGNMNNLMKQAQKMQQDMVKAQEELAVKTVEATVGGGAVTVVATGAKEIKEIRISREAVDPDDVETLQDLVLAAVNEALRQADELTKSTMGGLTGGLGNIPGLF
jgi:DNA-binding YbaB/EbfC family protein